MISPTPLSIAALALLAAALSVPPAARAEEASAHPILRGFERTGRYVLYVDGREQAQARIYNSRRAGAFLVLESDFGDGILIEPRARTVSDVPVSDVLRRADGSVDLLDGAALRSLGSFTMEGGDVVINVEGLVARMRPRPWLLGPQKAEDLLLHTPEYARESDLYRTRDAEVAQLRAFPRAAEVTVFFGTWCPTCRRLLPRILKLDRELQGSKVRFVYYGLPKGDALYSDPAAQRESIRGIPTGVVDVEGRRAGRIDSSGLSRPEAAVHGVLFGGR